MDIFMKELDALSSHYEYENAVSLSELNGAYMESDDSEEYKLPSFGQRAMGIVNSAKRVVEDSVQKIIEQIKKFYQEMRDRINQFKNKIELSRYDNKTMFRLKIDLGDKHLAKEVMELCKLQSKALNDLNAIWLRILNGKIESTAAIKAINDIKNKYDKLVDERVVEIANRYMSYETGMQKSRRQYTLVQVKRRLDESYSLKNNVAKTLEDDVMKFYKELPNGTKKLKGSEEERIALDLINAINTTAASISMRISSKSIGALSGLESYAPTDTNSTKNSYNNYINYNDRKIINHNYINNDSNDSPSITTYADDLGINEPNDDTVSVIMDLQESGDDVDEFLNTMYEEFTEGADETDLSTSFFEESSTDDDEFGDDFINSLFEESGESNKQTTDFNLDDLDSLFDNI